MKIHWRTEDRWLREFLAGDTFAGIAWDAFPWKSGDLAAEAKAIDVVEDAIRRAILRRERKRK